MSVVRLRSRRTRRASPKVSIAQKLAQTYRHIPFRARVAAAAGLLGLCCIVLLGAILELGARGWQPVATAEPVTGPFWPPSSMLLPTGHSRPVYPYSVIAGGAQSAQELNEAVATDPVVAQHYADFDITKARRMILDAPKLVYVSYRIGNKVFWTKNKLALRKGEAILSDGTNMARTRCGNRISVLPVRPNAPAEPSSSDLDGPEFPAIASSPYLAAYSAPVPALFSGPTPGGPRAAFVPVAPFFPLPGGGGIIGTRNSSTPPPGGGSGGGIPSPLSGPPGNGGGGNSGGGTTPPGGGTPGGGGGGTPGGGGGTPTPVGVPEPGTAVLVLMGLGAAAMRARRKQKAC